jgi:hypothetical protein
MELKKSLTPRRRMKEHLHSGQARIKPKQQDVPLLQVAVGR